MSTPMTDGELLSRLMQAGNVGCRAEYQRVPPSDWQRAANGRPYAGSSEEHFEPAHWRVRIFGTTHERTAARLVTYGETFASAARKALVLVGSPAPA